MWFVSGNKTDIINYERIFNKILELVIQLITNVISAHSEISFLKCDEKVSYFLSKA